MENLLSLKSKIEKELTNLFPDLKVSVYEKADVVTAEQKWLLQQGAYVGMQIDRIDIQWNRFFDKIAGNGWMYGNLEVISIDNSDYDSAHAYVNEFIQKMKVMSQII